MSEEKTEEKNEFELISISFDEKEVNTEEGSLDLITNQITRFCKSSFEEAVNKANDLIKNQMQTQVSKDDKKAYDEAKELYSKHKTLWVKIDKDTDLIKKNIRPVLEKVQDFSDKIYNPLQESGKKLKNKMLVYEVEQERKKQEKKEKELAKQKRKEEIATKLLSLNTDYLVKIQNSQTIEEIDNIKEELSNYDVSIFDEQSANATFQITQLNMTCDMMRNNIIMRIEQEKMKKQEEERLAEQKRKEDEELKANQEKIAQKLKEEEEAKERQRKIELEALAKIKEEEEKANAVKFEIVSEPIISTDSRDLANTTFTSTGSFTPKPVTMIVDEKDSRDIMTEETQEIANSIGNENTCPTSKIDIEEDELQSFGNDLTSVNDVNLITKKEDNSILFGNSSAKVNQAPSYNEMLKELFEREIEWFVKNNSSITNEQFAITLAQIVEKQKENIFNY